MPRTPVLMLRASTVTPACWSSHRDTRPVSYRCHRFSLRCHWACGYSSGASTSISGTSTGWRLPVERLRRTGPRHSVLVERRWRVRRSLGLRPELTGDPLSRYRHHRCAVGADLDPRRRDDPMVEAHRQDRVGAHLPCVVGHPLDRFPAPGDEVLLAGCGQATRQRTGTLSELVLRPGRYTDDLAENRPELIASQIFHGHDQHAAGYPDA